MPEISTQTCFTQVVFPLSNILEKEREERKEQKRKTSVKIAPINETGQKSVRKKRKSRVMLHRGSALNIQDLLKPEFFTSDEEKDRGEKTALVPDMEIIKYHAYEDSIAQKLFGKKFRNNALYVCRNYAILVQVSLLLSGIALGFIFPLLFSRTSEAKCMVLSIFIVVNWVFLFSTNYCLAAYPIVKRIFRSFDALFLSSNVIAFLITCGIFCYKRYNNGYQSVPYAVSALWVLILLLADAAPRKMQEGQRNLFFVIYVLLTSVVLAMVVTLNLYAAQDKIDEEWIFVGPMKFSLVRLMSTFGMNGAILLARFSVNAKFNPGTMLFIKNTERMVKISSTEDIK